MKIVTDKLNNMKFSGLLLKESLKDANVLDMLHIIDTETWNVKNATKFQPNVWTAVYFEANMSKADVISKKLSKTHLRIEGGMLVSQLTNICM